MIRKLHDTKINEVIENLNNKGMIALSDIIELKIFLKKIICSKPGGNRIFG